MPTTWICLFDVPVPALNTYYWPNYSYQSFQTTVNYTWPEVDPFGTGGQYYFVLEVRRDPRECRADETDHAVLSNSFGVSMPNLMLPRFRRRPQVDPGQQ